MIVLSGLIVFSAALLTVGDAWVRLIAVAAACLFVAVLWILFLLWPRSVRRAVLPRVYLTTRRLLRWNPRHHRVHQDRGIPFDELLGFQIVPKTDGTALIRGFRRAEAGTPELGDALQDLRSAPRGGSRVDMRPMLALSLLGPGPPPSDVRLMAAGAVLWMSWVPMPAALRLREEIARRVPDAVLPA